MQDKEEESIAGRNGEDFALAAALQQSLLLSENDETKVNSNSSRVDSRKAKDGGTILDPIQIATPSGNDSWELTWPIWHMLPFSERKEIAKQNGFQTIGEFEEEVILTKALNDISDSGHSNEVEYTNENTDGSENSVGRNGLPVRTESALNITHEKKDYKMDKCADDESSEASDDDSYSLEKSESHDENEEKNVEEGGAILYLTDEFILHSIFPFLSTEYYAICALVSSHWKSFTRSELAYKDLCKRLYLNQSKRKALRVARFGGSYRTMLENRFRLKTGCGLYVLKCSKIKKIQRDMWTEIPAGVVLETTYYRYLYFFENGKVLYSLTSRPPHEQIPIFRRVLVTNQTQQSTIFGTYQIQKDECVVSIEHPWHHVRLFLRVMENGCPGSVGKFWSLQFEKHQSSASNDFDEYWSRDLVEYDVPIEPFRFLRSWRL